MISQDIEPLFNIFYNSVGQLSTTSKRIYADGLVVWLGVKQALECLSLRGTMEELFTPRAKRLMGDCLRTQNENISSNPGGFVQARQCLSEDFMSSALYSTFTYIRQRNFWNGYRVLGVDGTTVPLNKTNKELFKRFPGGGDLKNKSRWPLIHLALMVDLLEGTIVSAKTGAKYGKNAISEQALSLDLFPLIDEKSLLIADRNYATFNICYELEKMGIKSLVRVNKVVSKYLNSGEELIDDTDKKVRWVCSKKVADRFGYSDSELLEGRLICKKIIYDDKEIILTFFTTLEIGAVDEIVELYKKRWNIESDLKTLKQGIKLKNIQSEKVNSVIAELYCKFIAFNLTRGLVLLAVRDTEIDPRRISFTAAWSIMRTMLPEYADVKNNVEKQKMLDHILTRIRANIIPSRPGRSYPRHVYDRRPGKYKKRPSSIQKTKRH